MANEKKVEKSEFEKFIEKARKSEDYYTSYLVKLIDLLKKKYYNLDVELEKSFETIKQSEKDRLEYDIIKKKLEELNEKEKLTAEEIIIHELLNEKYKNLTESIKRADCPSYMHVRNPFDANECLDIIDWFNRTWHLKPEEDCMCGYKPVKKNIRSSNSIFQKQSRKLSKREDVPFIGKKP